MHGRIFVCFGNTRARSDFTETREFIAAIANGLMNTRSTRVAETLHAYGTSPTFQSDQVGSGVHVVQQLPKSLVQIGIRRVDFLPFHQHLTALAHTTLF